MIYTVTLNPALDRTLTVSSLETNQVLRASRVSLDWGGKGFNVSRAIQGLGGESKVLGFIGGATGKLLQDGLEALHLSTDLVRIKGETRTNIVILEESTSKHIKVNEPGPEISQIEQNELVNKVKNLTRKGDLWALCGSLPPNVPAEFFAILIRTIQKNGAQACLDTSGEALKHGLLAQPFLIKPNREEAGEALGIDIKNSLDLKDAANQFHALGIPWVAISCGADGLLFSYNGYAIFAPAPTIIMANSVGAGDALLAGILWAFNRGMELKESAAWGVAAGTASAQLVGVDFVPYSLVQKIYDEVIKQIFIM